jgi:hypothetical protein
MGAPAGAPDAPPGLLRRLQDRAEEWVYRANERNHWIFRLYDLVNEGWARLALRGERGRAEAIDAVIQGRDAEARVRFLTPADLEPFAALLAAFDSRYLPPHGLDRAAAAAALRRRSYVPLGIFFEGELIGYLLVRLFFPRRAVTGIWILPRLQNRRFGVNALLASWEWTRSEGLPDYCTVPVDNPNSVKTALAAGWRIVRTNRRFHVLLRHEPRASWPRRLLASAEVLIYELNERHHWAFRLYDACNELWARLVFRRVRRRASRIDVPLPGRQGTARLRFLTPADAEAFAGLLARFDFKYLPPHPLDRESARRALRRTSYLPFGIFDGEELVGYTLVRLFFPWRAVHGVWSLPSNYNRGFSQMAVKKTSDFTGAQGLNDFVTVPVDNVHSLRGAQWAGWRIIRSNRRFHLLRHSRRPSPEAAALEGGER